MRSRIVSKFASATLLDARIVKGSRLTVNTRVEGVPVMLGAPVVGFALGRAETVTAVEGVGEGAGLSVGTSEGCLEPDGWGVMVGASEGEGDGAGDSVGGDEGARLVVGWMRVGMTLGDGDGAGLSVGTYVGRAVADGPWVVVGRCDGDGDGLSVSVGSEVGVGDLLGAVGLEDCDVDGEYEGDAEGLSDTVGRKSTKKGGD